MHLRNFIVLISTILAVLLIGACKDKGENQSLGTKPPQTQSPKGFAISFPTDNSTADTDIVTVRGTGAPADASVEIDVFTNEWYPQNGTSEIDPEGNWAYSPCYLKGQGSYKRHHNIRARLMLHNQQVAVKTIYDVAVR